MTVVRTYQTLHRETRAENVFCGWHEMNVDGVGISVGVAEMRDKIHRGEGPPR